MPRRLAHSASEALTRPSTTDAGLLRRSASEQHALRKRDLFSASSTTAEAQILAREMARDTGPLEPAKAGWKPPSLFRIHTPPERLAGRKPQGIGRLSSEDFGQWMHTKGFQPGVRQKVLRGIKPVSLPTEQEIRGRARPKTAIQPSDDTETQAFTLRGTVRSSDVWGVGAKNARLAVLSKQPTAAELNYEAQFLYNDWRVSQQTQRQTKRLR